MWFETGVLVLMVLGAFASVAPKTHAPQIFHGRFNGKCGDDGIYYRDSRSFVFCSYGNSYIQPCAPGTENSEYDAYERQLGRKTYNTEFCNINLVDSGYYKHPGSYMADIHLPNQQREQKKEEEDKYVPGYDPREKQPERTISAYNRPLYQPPEHEPNYRPHQITLLTGSASQSDVGERHRYNTDRSLFDLDKQPNQRSLSRGDRRQDRFQTSYRKEERYGEEGIYQNGAERYESKPDIYARPQDFKSLHQDYDPNGMHPPYLRLEEPQPEEYKPAVGNPFRPSDFPHLAVPTHGLILNLPGNIGAKGPYSDDFYQKDFADVSSQYNDVRPKEDRVLFHQRRRH